MSIRLVKRVADAIALVVEDIAEQVIPRSFIRHPVQVQKAILRAIDREGIVVFLDDIYVCNVACVLIHPADLEYAKMKFPRTFRHEIHNSILNHIRSKYAQAKNKDDGLDLKIIEDPEVRRGTVDVEAWFEEAKCVTAS